MNHKRNIFYNRSLPTFKTFACQKLSLRKKVHWEDTEGLGGEGGGRGDQDGEHM